MENWCHHNFEKFWNILLTLWTQKYTCTRKKKLNLQCIACLWVRQRQKGKSKLATLQNYPPGHLISLLHLYLLRGWRQHVKRKAWTERNIRSEVQEYPRAQHQRDKEAKMSFSCENFSSHCQTPDVFFFSFGDSVEKFLSFVLYNIYLSVTFHLQHCKV